MFEFQVEFFTVRNFAFLIRKFCNSNLELEMLSVAMQSMNSMHNVSITACMRNIRYYYYYCYYCYYCYYYYYYYYYLRYYTATILLLPPKVLLLNERTLTTCMRNLDETSRVQNLQNCPWPQTVQAPNNILVRNYAKWLVSNRKLHVTWTFELGIMVSY